MRDCFGSTDLNPKSLNEVVSALSRRARRAGKSAVIVSGCSDLLALVKERIVNPDVLVNLKSIPGMDQIKDDGGGLKIGGLASLDTIAHDARIRAKYVVLSEAAGVVATPQIRNAGTLAGNVCQRPWHPRNAFPCYKNGGNT